MEFVPAQFIYHPHHHQETTGHPERQTEDVDEAVNSVAKDVSQSNLEIVGEHVNL